MAVNILLYEDNALLRESLRSLIGLNDRYHVSGAYDNVLEIKNQLQEHSPDVILMDIDMPGMNGIQAVKQVRQLNPDVAIIMLTVFDDNTNVFDALKSGATGYILKQHISTKLFSAIDEVLEGGAPMSPSIARMVIQSMRPSGNYGLTQREHDVLSSLSKGNSYKLIATEYGISLDTVRTHIKHIYEKLRVHSQTEAVSKAINEKLV
jgi:DNA-binding NarL/FixJ family response regulator